MTEPTLHDLAGLKEAVARVDAADAACPIRSSSKSPEHCPRCYATDRQNCGPNVAALDALDAAVRAFLASNGHTGSEPSGAGEL